MPDDGRIATLVTFVSRLERTACDDELNLMDLEGIVKLTHHKLRQPQDMGSKSAPKYLIGWLGSSETS